ncbi:hypothetical protein [Aureitalea marina]|uniref:Uncharacterized protein n=1 Tax=Aureitalea marina TaxID=930804 RepID=A0A2S7KMG8_9FLAO|nr:hypothetical protein [Aureitalea marina]PQB03825.1 hypothetical protein BST85_02100 [Aureitalea marina]
MFSSGQLIFAIFFVIAFVALMVFSYRKDKQLHRKHYKGSLWVLVGFLLFSGLLLFLKWYLKD